MPRRYIQFVRMGKGFRVLEYTGAGFLESCKDVTYEAGFARMTELVNEGFSLVPENNNRDYVATKD